MLIDEVEALWAAIAEGDDWAPLAAKLLQVTPKAVDLMLAQLGGARPRELTGRSRYRAWGIV